MTQRNSKRMAALALAAALTLAGSASALFFGRKVVEEAAPPSPADGLESPETDKFPTADPSAKPDSVPKAGTVPQPDSAPQTTEPDDAPRTPEADGESTAPPAAEPLAVETYRDIPGEGTFPGEGLTYAVEKPPKKGIVDIDGSRFTYTPQEGFTGTDRFTYTATDSAGRVSSPAKVTVRVSKPKSGVQYADMEGSPAALAAQELAEAGVFTGERIGGQYFFGPEETLSRAEFLAMAMEALGCPASDVTLTGFSDDDSIPAWAKSYAAAGVAQGILRGKATEDGVAFLGDEPVTWAQAAAILNRALSPENVDLQAWFGEQGQLVSWAAQAVGNLEASGVLEAGSFGSLTVEKALTRADAARLLSSARTALSEDSGLWDSLRELAG